MLITNIMLQYLIYSRPRSSLNAAKTQQHRYAVIIKISKQQRCIILVMDTLPQLWGR